MSAPENTNGALPTESAWQQVKHPPGNASPSAATEVQRPLSPVERWYWIADQISPLNVIARARVRGALSEQLLRRALATLQTRHPLLRVAIATDTKGTGLQFVPHPSRAIPLRHVALSSTDPDPDTAWQREVNERELLDRVDGHAGPLARTAVLTHEATEGPQGCVHDLLLTLSHCIADGTTALSLLKEWIQIADQLGSHSQNAQSACTHQHDLLASAPVLPAPEDLFPRRYRGPAGSVTALVHQLRDEHRRLRHRPQRVIPSEAIPFQARRTRFLHRSLTPEQLRALVRTCRQEGVTVHGALGAAMVAAIARDAGDGTQGHFAIGSPVDFRSKLVPPVTPYDVGAYVATLPTFVEYSPQTSLWSMARAINKDLARRQRRGEHFSVINLLGWACPRTLAKSMSFLRNVEERGAGNLCLSNIGRYNFPSTIGQWEISDAQFIAGISVSGYFVATVNTSHDRLFWNFTYIDGIVPSDRAERLANECVHVLMSAAQS